jgi:hypothetical protein
MTISVETKTPLGIIAQNYAQIHQKSTNVSSNSQSIFQSNDETQDLSTIEKGGLLFGTAYLGYKIGKKASPYVAKAGKYTFNFAKSKAPVVKQAMKKGANKVGQKYSIAKNFAKSKAPVVKDAMKKSANKVGQKYSIAKNFAKSKAPVVKDAMKKGANKVGQKYSIAKNFAKSKAPVVKQAMKKGANKAYTKSVKTCKSVKEAIEKNLKNSSKILNGESVIIGEKAVKALGTFGKILGRGAVPLQVALGLFEIKKAYDEGGSKSALKQSGKSCTGLVGGLAGAKLGAMLGTAICPGIGTAVGTFLGGMIGYFAGEAIADKLS